CPDGRGAGNGRLRAKGGNRCLEDYIRRRRDTALARTVGPRDIRHSGGRRGSRLLHQDLRRPGRGGRLQFPLLKRGDEGNPHRWPPNRFPQDGEAACRGINDERCRVGASAKAIQGNCRSPPKRASSLTLIALARMAGLYGLLLQQTSLEFPYQLHTVAYR